MINMEREIKFRGQRVDNKEWVYGYLMNIYSNKRLFMGKWINIGGEARVKDELFYSYKEVIPKSIGQFTGLKDSEGKEIYEGDIIETDCGIKVIKYKDGMFVAYLDSHSALNCFDKITVIGTKFQNPELLK